MLNIFDELELKRPQQGLGIPRNEGEILFNYIKVNKIKRVVETGLASGFTSTYILAALPIDGNLTSFEINPIEKKDTFVPPEYWDRWQIINSSSEEGLLSFFQSNPGIDLFFHDSEHHYKTQMFEYETAYPFIKYIGSHDIRLYGPVFAWPEFITKRNIKHVIELGQIGLGEK